MQSYLRWNELIAISKVCFNLIGVRPSPTFFGEVFNSQIFDLYYPKCNATFDS